MEENVQVKPLPILREAMLVANSNFMAKVNSLYKGFLPSHSIIYIIFEPKKKNLKNLC